MNSKIVSEPTGEQMTLFSPVGSLNYASHTALQENDLEKKTPGISGRKCLDAFGRLSRAGSWAKTFSELLIGTGDWSSTRCKLTWKLKGTKYKRLYFQLAPSMPRTDEIESGLWPTPQATERHRTDVAEQMREEGKPLYYRRTKDGKARQFSPLEDAAYKRMLPTPKTTDGRHANYDRGKSNLGEEMSQWGQDNGIGFQLNPRFVAEMMGFPSNWTELPFLNGETNPSKPTETP